MKKGKRLLAVLLAMVMMLTTFSASMVAFAEELKAKAPATDVSAVEEKIAAYDGKNEKAYTEMVDAYTALTLKQKDSVDPSLLSKLAYSVASKLAGSTSSTKVSAKAKDAVKLLNGDKGDELSETVLTEVFKAVTVDKVINLRGDKLIESYKKLSPSARVVAQTGYSFYFLYCPLNDTGSGSYFKSVFDIYVDKAKKSDEGIALKPDTPDYEALIGKPPVMADFPGDFMGYMNAKKEYDAKKAAIDAENMAPYESAMVKMAANMFADETKLTQYKAIAQFIDKYDEAMKLYNETGDYSKAVEVNNWFKSLSGEMRGIMSVMNHKANDGKMVREMVSYIDSIAQLEKVDIFEELVASMKAPYTAEDLAKVQAAYAVIPDNILDLVDADILDKAYDIAHYAKAHSQSTELPDLSGYLKTDVSYPQKAPHDAVTKAIPNMDTLVQEVAKAAGGQDLTATVNGIYTNASLTAIAHELFPMLESLGLGDVSPAAYLARIANKDGDNWVAKNPKYKGAVAALVKVSEDTNDWADVEFVNGDFFLGTNKDEFCNVLASYFTVAYNLAQGNINLGDTLFKLLQLENIYDYETAEFTTGSYENIVHIFEAVGIACIGSGEYTLAVNAAPTVEEKTVARLAPIFKSIFDFIDIVAADPVTTITAILPDVAAALNSGLINDNVQEIMTRIAFILQIVGNMTGVDFSAIDLTTEGLFNTIGIFSALGIEGITFEEEKNSAGEVNVPDNGVLTIAINDAELNIKEADFIQLMKDLEGCGKPVVADSVCVENAYRARIEADKADVFVTLVRFVYDDIIQKNPTAVRTIIRSLNPDVALVLAPVISVVLQFLPTDTVIVALVTVANSFAGTTPEEPENPDDGGDDSDSDDENKSFFDRIKDALDGIIETLFGGNNGDDSGNDNNNNDDNDGFFGDDDDDADLVGDPDIPHTAGTVAGGAAAIAVLAAVSATGIAFVVKKKHEDE